MSEKLDQAKAAIAGALANKTNRRALLAGAGAAAAGAIAFSVRPRGELTIAGNQVALGDLKALGDGFYLADGWVLSEADLHAAGVTLPHAKAE